MFAPAIAFVDLETTGTTSTGDRITEIGIVRVAEGEFLDEWSTLVNPERSIPGDARGIDGVDDVATPGHIEPNQRKSRADLASDQRTATAPFLTFRRCVGF